MKKVFAHFMVFFLIFLMSACKLPATGVPQATLLPQAAYTEAVMTIMAGYTQTALAPNPTDELLLPVATQILNPNPPSPPELRFTETPVPSASLTATLLPALPQLTATPVLEASDPRFGLGDPLFKDSFDNAQNWPIYSDDHVKIQVENGKMSMVARKPDFFNSWILTWMQATDFYLEASAISGACGGRDRFGLIFRVPDVSVSEGYLFAFSCSGMYSIWYWDGKKETDLIDWKASEFIHQGEGKLNRIGIRADGNLISLYANGILITTLTDKRLEKGYFGTFVGSAQTKDYIAEFDEIALWGIE